VRVTTNLMVNNLLHDLGQASRRLEQGERKIASLRRINKPSDDPGGAVAALRLKNTIAEAERYISNIDSAETWLRDTESCLSNLTMLLNSAMQNATRAASGVLPQSSMEAIAQDLDQLVREAVSLANQTHQQRSLFGGHSTDKPPAEITAEADGFVRSVTLSQDTGEITRHIGPNTLMSVNYTAESVFGTQGQDLISGIISLRDAVTNQDYDSVKQIRDDLERHHARVISLTTEVGAKVNRLYAGKERLEIARVESMELLSRLEDLDLAGATVELYAAENAYRVALAMGARVIMPTLMDYLR